MGAGEGKLQEGRQLQEHRPQRRGQPAQGGGGGGGLDFQKMILSDVDADFTIFLHRILKAWDGKE